MRATEGVEVARRRDVVTTEEIIVAVTVYYAVVDCIMSVKGADYDMRPLHVAIVNEE